MEQEKIFLVEYTKNLFAENSNCISFVRHVDGEVLYVSDKLSDLLNYNKENFDTIELDLDNLFAENSNYNYSDIKKDQERLKQGVEIVDIVITLKSISNLLLLSLIPIQYQGKYIGYYAVARNVHIPSYMELILFHTKNPKFRKIDKRSSIALSEQEREILFLLISGFTQEEIAEYFECSRGFIGKLIAKKICPKFGIIGSSTKLLVGRTLLYGVLDTIIPERITNELNSIPLIPENHTF
jgi:hypothetical protein